MPSGARLMAAILLSLSAMGALTIGAMHIDEVARERGVLLPLAALLGAFFGWSALGGRLGAGFAKAFERGILAMLMVWFWGTLIVAGEHVYRGLQAHYYKQPMDAVNGLVGKFIEMMGIFVDVRIALAALIGGMIAGAISEYTSMIWN